MLPVGLLVSVAALVWLGAVALRRRYLSRMALRQFTRRPNETLLVIAGSILGTALITGSFITGDSLTTSFTDTVYERLGEVDEQVILTTPRAQRQAERNIEMIRGLDLVDGAVLVDTTTGVARNAGDTSLTEPRVEVYSLDVEDLDTFGSGEQSVGGPSLAAGDAIVTRELADELGLREGDTVELLVFGTDRQFRIDRIAEGEGFASYREGKNLFVAPGVLADLAAARPTARPPTNQMWISNTGDARSGAELTFAVKSDIERALDDEGIEILEIKKSLVESAEEGAASISQLFLVIASFAIVAGILLLVNIFVMLAAERRSELGMLRAVGMKRGDLVRGFALEGSMYALAASSVGVLAGVGVGVAVVFISGKIFEQTVFFGDLSIDLVLLGSSLVAGFVVGFAISIVTIFITSLRVSRVNIIAAIRDLEIARVSGHRIRNFVVAPVMFVAGAALTVLGVANEQGIIALIGPALMGVGLVWLLGRFVSQRLLVTIVGFCVLVWGIVVPLLIDLFKDDDEFTFVVQGLVTTFAGILVIAANQEVVAATARRLVSWRPGVGLAARLATTYPVARRFRTGMTLVMYALIVFTLVLITTFGHVMRINTESVAREESAGFEIVGNTNPSTPATAGDLETTDGVDVVFGVMTSPYTLRTFDGDEETDTVQGVDDRFIRLTRYGLTEVADEYETDEAAWRAVAEDPDLVILNSLFGNSNGGPESRIQLEIGDEVEMVDPLSGETKTRQVIGFNDAGLAMPGSFISMRALERQFTGAGESRWLILSDQSTDPRVLADRLNAEHVDIGLEAITIGEIVEDVMSLNLQFFGLLRGYLALGLVVGIVGLGVIMVRAVRERRRAIGVLRALGFRSSTVRNAFMGEAAIVAAEGILMGILLGVVTARSVITSSLGDQFEVPFAVPWSSVAILASLTFVFSVLVAVLPARAAAKIRPAVALRIAD